MQVNHSDVAVIGAGPYGLSVAAHLKSAGVDFRIFGYPMEFWLNHMPKGMHLKSEGFASSLYDPGSKFPLREYCREKSLPYADLGSPVPLDQFSSYGLEFQARYVPDVVRQKVSRVEPSPEGFKITLGNGEVYTARRVVVAVGLAYYEYVPAELASLPPEVVSHSARHTVLDGFKNREVAIVGAGASALDLAALLHEAGASVQLIARVAKLKYHDPPQSERPGLMQQLKAPVTGIGFGWKLWLCANLPLAFRLMPEEFRIEKVKRVLGPAPCWFIRDQVEGKVKIHFGATVQSAEMKNGRVHVNLTDASGTKTVEADHVIAATGYKYDVARLAFLDPGILNRLRRVGDAPGLSANFESSVKNLYFIGVTAANTFGPLLRFAFGAGFAAPRIARHLEHSAMRKSSARIRSTSNTQPIAERKSA
jgi:cation diffusion facilitator CzcD-associated flavoprotein CzcO